MARSLDPKSAAEEIRSNVHVGRLSPEEQHMHVFVVSVCEHLGIEADPINFMAVAKALHDADIQPYLIQEYPKMLVVDGRPIRSGPEQDGPDEEGPIVVFENEEEEAEYRNEGSVHKPTDEELAVKADADRKAKADKKAAAKAETDGKAVDPT